MEKNESTSVRPPPVLISNQQEHLLACPACGGFFKSPTAEGTLECAQCYEEFGSESGIPLMFWPREPQDHSRVTADVKLFYERTPFPNYETEDNIDTLRKKGGAGVYVPLLDQQIPDDATVLEAGCGTGQLSNYLASRGSRTVFATDMSLSSLKLGNEFKQQNNIDNVTFCQMNLFRPFFRPESFDYVISNGVLHHTMDPYMGFQSIAALVKIGGYIIVGLYNKYGRLATDLRRAIFQLSKNKFTFLDSRLGSGNLGDHRRTAWFKDQYQNPHESKHGIGEVLQWFRASGFEFTCGVPMVKVLDSFPPATKLFEKHQPGSALDHSLVQAKMVLTGLHGSGFFVMIGKRVV